MDELFWVRKFFHPSLRITEENFFGVFYKNFKNCGKCNLGAKKSKIRDISLTREVIQLLR
jgi:hypothetical protein